MRLNLFKEKATEIVDGEPGFCPKRKGGRRYQGEVLQNLCRKCRVKRKYCPEKVKGGKHATKSRRDKGRDRDVEADEAEGQTVQRIR